ncbi:MAG: efflux RND transporter periplasmic adaptor subunit [Defluviicoccus sp.]
MTLTLIAAAAAAAIAVADLGPAFVDGALAAPPEAPAGVPVEARPVQVGPLSDVIAAVGTLISNESVMLRPEISGRVAGIHFVEGAPARQNELLVTLDDAIVAAELADTRASLELSKRNFERARELYRERAGTERTLDEAKAKLNSDQAKVELALARQSKTRITAPFDGILGLRRVSIGDFVNAGDDLVNIESIDPIKIDFRVPERSLALIETGQTIDITVDAFLGQTFRGEIYALDPQIDPAGRSVAMRARISNREGLLRPGLFARVSVIVTDRPQAIIVPEQAIIPFGNDRFVFRVVDGVAKRTKVTLGVRRLGAVEVVDGLKADDVVVTAGQLKLKDGTAVTVLAPPPES